MIKKILLALGLAAVMSLSVSSAFAQDPGHRFEHRQMHNQRTHADHGRHHRHHRFSHHRHGGHRNHR